jgi:hypothetical protein
MFPVDPRLNTATDMSIAQQPQRGPKRDSGPRPSPSGSFFMAFGGIFWQGVQKHHHQFLQQVYVESVYCHVRFNMTKPNVISSLVVFGLSCFCRQDQWQGDFKNAANKVSFLGQ